MTDPGPTPSKRRVSRSAAALLSVTRRLPPDREDALLAVLRDVRALATGRRPDALDRSTRLTGSEVRAFAAAEEGDDAEARRLVDGILARDPTDLVALGVLRTLQTRQGSLTDAVTTIGRMRAIKDSPALAVAQRQIQGRLIETEAGWLPRLAGPSETLAPRAANVVLHLQKETVPYLHNGFTIRSSNTVRAQRDVGLEPVVVSSLGFPRCVGTDVVPARESVEGITYHRLDLGAGYPCDAPPDVALKEATWLTARVVREERPAVIHAHSGHRGFETALTALALRTRYGMPVVYEVRSFLEASWSSDPEHAESAEQYRRRFETEDRTMHAVRRGGHDRRVHALRDRRPWHPGRQGPRHPERGGSGHLCPTRSRSRRSSPVRPRRWPHDHRLCQQPGQPARRARGAARGHGSVAWRPVARSNA